MFDLGRATLSVLLAATALATSACSSEGSTPAPGEASADGGEASRPSGPPTMTFAVRRDGKELDVDTVVFGEKIIVRLGGLVPGADVKVRARSRNPYTKGRGYTSTVTFTADADGRVDLEKATPAGGGSYADADADGLFWSMTDTKEATDIGDDPFAVTVDVTDAEGSVLVTRTLPRSAFAEGVVCQSVTTNGLVGTYCAPPAEAPKRRGVVAFGGSEGGSFGGTWRAMIFASWGYPTLGLAYFGEGKLPVDLQKIPLEYFAKAMDWLDGQPSVLPGTNVVAGVSRGGELALLLGATYPRVVGVIADVPSGVVWGDGSGNGAAWTRADAEVPFMPWTATVQPEIVSGPKGATAMRTRAMYFASISEAAPTARDAATIHVEDTHGPVLLQSGATDDLWPSCDLAQIAFARLEAAGHVAKHGDESICYPDAGHAIGTLGGPTTDAMWTLYPGVGYLALGGTAKGIAAARRAVDERHHAFLDRVAR